MSTFRSILLAAALLLGSHSAQAITVYNDDFSGLGALTSPGSISTSFSAPVAGAGSISFDLAGYNTLDSFNCCTDIFTLTLNGIDIFSGSFDMGGGGSNAILLNPNGGTATSVSYGFNMGGLTQVWVPLSVLAGTNTLQFSYTGAAQGLGDEGWGVNGVTVTAVPEPETWALFGSGLLLLAVVRRRQHG